MSVIFSCHHENDFNNGVELSLKTTTIDFDLDRIVPAVSYGFYCAACADEYEREGFVLHGQAEERAYMGSDASEWMTL